uniref:Lipoprotein n=1 Tax=Streptomyces sp. NBC_00049 TaxID=2903617 RepID=A0AAU2JP83_9ACTN
MRTLTRRILLPGLTALALTATGCSSAPHTAAEPAAPATLAPAADGTSQQLDVAAAPQGTPTPAAVARAGGKGKTEKSALKVASYDRTSGRAVIAKAPQGPTRSPSPGTSPEADKPVAVGDVIASAPAPGAPEGLLAKVTEVVGKSDAGTEVKAASTTLAAVLGDDKADGKVPVDPSAVTVEPLMKGVTFSWAKGQGLTFGPEGAKLPLGNLRLDVNASVDTAPDAPASAGASVSGFVQLAPQVEFAYDGGTGGSPGPRGAFLGMSGDWSSQWKLQGRAAASTGAPKRIPFAKLHSSPVLQVGPVPVVVNLDLTCYIQVEADGRVTLDVQQDVKGDFKVGGSYAAGKGWTPVSASNVQSTPVRASVTAAGQVKGALGAEASVGLYGAVGVTADFAPYLRGEADLKAAASSDGKTSLSGAWALYGGFDLSGHLQLQLSLFGTPVFERRIPLGSLHREWALSTGRTGR